MLLKITLKREYDCKVVY
uniref:Uncharacterized protein n=1 Tax=Vitis vinifera TaxID=29760 RepID=F6HK29_VITVI